MPSSVKSLGQLLRKTRLEQKLTLEELKEQIKDRVEVSVATLSRIERAAFDGSVASIRSDTHAALTAWIDSTQAPNIEGGSTPEIVNLHLRADKNLSADTAEALGQMFKLAYEVAVTKAEKDG